MRRELVAIWMLLASVNSAVAQVGIGVGTPNVSIGINIPVYPELVPVPGYPVYYAPRLSGFALRWLVWVYRGDWHASPRYNGPGIGDPVYARVRSAHPVRYYLGRSVYFRGAGGCAPALGPALGP
jgi:hypothetical protein